jgi:predicted phage-related endonuclease
VQLGDGAREWIEAYHQAKEVVKVAETRLDEIKNWLKVQLGDAGSGYIEDEKVVGFPEVTTRRIAVTKLRELFPEIAEQVTETTTHRRMTVKKLK